MRKFTILKLWFHLSFALFLLVPAPTNGRTGVAPGTSSGEQAAIIIGKSFMSLAAAAATKATCSNIANRYDVSIRTFESGSGRGIMNGTIVLETSQFQSSAKGTKYRLTQQGEGSMIGNFIRNYAGEFQFSFKGDLLTGTANFEQKEFDIYSPWSLTFINESWGITQSHGQKIINHGLNAISKVDFPRSKWRQTAEQTRPNIEDGFWVSKMTLISSTNTSKCSITLAGSYDYLSGGVFFEGAILVSPY